MNDIKVGGPSEKDLNTAYLFNKLTTQVVGPDTKANIWKASEAQTDLLNDLEESYPASRVTKALLRLGNMAEKYATKELSSTEDPLTGLDNRRKADLLLDNMIGHMRHEQDGTKGVCVVMLDVNWFKIINDTYGHKVGDDILIEIAGLLDDNARGSDVVARWGGEEFLLVLDQIDLPSIIKKFGNMEAQTVEGRGGEFTDRVNKALKQVLPELLPKDIKMSGNEKSIAGTVAWGYKFISSAEYNQNGFTPVTAKDILLNEADSQMYKTKEMIKVEAEDKT